MKQALEKTFFRIADETLQRLAFIFSFPEEGDETSPEAAVAASVRFSGPFSGKIVMKISNDVLPEMAANMLGLDDDEGEPPLEQQYDALKEALNVVCGNFLPAVAGEEAVFDIQPPCIVEDNGEGEGDEGALSVVKFAVEDGRCDLYLTVDGPMPGP